MKKKQIQHKDLWNPKSGVGKAAFAALDRAFSVLTDEKTRRPEILGASVLGSLHYSQASS